MDITFGATISSSDLEKMVVEKSGDKLTGTQAHLCLSLMKTVIEEALSKGAKIVIPGFINFTPVYRPERSGTNTFTNEPFTTPEKAIVNIKPGSHLKDAVKKITGENLQKLKEMKK